MNQTGMKTLNQQMYRVKDLDDVLALLKFVAARAEQADRVIRELRTRNASLEQIAAKYAHEQSIKQLQQSVIEPEGNRPVDTDNGAIIEVNNDKAAIVEELREAIQAENEAAYEAGELDMPDEAHEPETHRADGRPRTNTKPEIEGYAIFFVQGSPRYRYQGKMVATSLVPENIKTLLLKAAESGQEPR